MGSSKQSQSSPTQRRYTTEQKEQAVRLVRKIRAETGQKHGAVQRVADQLGYGLESVRSWVRQADIDDGAAPGISLEDAERMKRLEQENRELRRANDPSAGVGFLRGGARPPTEVIVAFIDANRAELGVEPICRVLQIAPSTYYAAKTRPVSARAARDAVLGAVIMTVWAKN